MEENKIFQGERLGFSGVLKVGGVATTSYSMTYQLLTLGGKISPEYPVEISEGMYCGVVDTTNLLGDVLIRFIIRDTLEDKVVSNQSIKVTVYR